MASAIWGNGTPSALTACSSVRPAVHRVRRLDPSGAGGRQAAVGDPDRVGLLLLAAIQGIAGLVTSGAVEAGQTDGLIADTVALFARGPQ
jgi:hypothetical protein